MTNTPTLLRRLAAGAAATAFAALLMAAPLTSQAAPKMAHHKMSHKTVAAKTVYVCKDCKAFYSPTMAKKMGYKDGMGHTLVKQDKAPAGYMDGSKMMPMGKKMGAAPAAGAKRVVVNTCPMTGEKIVGEGVGMSVVENYEVHFCCPMCKPEFDGLPKATQLQKIQAALAKN